MNDDEQPSDEAVAKYTRSHELTQARIANQQRIPDEVIEQMKLWRQRLQANPAWKFDTRFIKWMTENLEYLGHEYQDHASEIGGIC